MTVTACFDIVRLSANPLQLTPSFDLRAWLSQHHGRLRISLFEEQNPMLGDFAGPIGTVILLLLAVLVLVKCSKIRLTDSMSAPELRKPGGAI